MRVPSSDPRSECDDSDIHHDLDSRSAIHDLVVHFYREIVFDDLLGPIFEEVAEVDWAVHLPKLVDYWCRVLLREPGYTGSILAPHQRVHDIEPFELEHFDRWYGLWLTSIDERWSGPVANHAKEHAARIATVLARRLVDQEWSATAQRRSDSAQRGTTTRGRWNPRATIR